MGAGSNAPPAIAPHLREGTPKVEEPFAEHVPTMPTLRSTTLERSMNKFRWHS